MSTDFQLKPINHLNRSSSDKNINFNPMDMVVHSRPTSHGAGQMSFGARDDAVLTLSSNESVASSPYRNAPSALAVLDVFPKNFGAVHTELPERDHVRTMSMVEQQYTVAYTRDLLLPIRFLPGEDDVKLKDNITYRTPDRKVVYNGELIVTKYRLLFATKSDDPAKVLVDVPLGMISQIEKIGGAARSNIKDRGTYGIEVHCKDLRCFFFGNAKEQHNRRTLFDLLTRLIFPFSISKPDITSPLQFFSSFFAWNYKKAILPHGVDDNWSLYKSVDEYVRMGIKRVGDAHWRIDTDLNQQYDLCDTYPKVLVVPSNFDAARIRNVAAFRSRNRIPVLSWYCRDTYVTITRASQPLTGLNRKNQDDAEYLEAIANTNVNQGYRLVILDARPKVNALANKANGGGYEDYPNCDLEFQNIHNIHVMRESLNKIHANIHLASYDPKITVNDLDNSNWLSHIRTIMTTVIRLVTLVHHDHRSVLVHCSDGWDRTAQMTSLAMMMLDGYYRTINGFIILVEKEWMSFGHKFFMRIGHGDKHVGEQSPVFLQFLDCTYQLCQQFESAFEFNENFLVTIADYLYSCQYGTFILNSEKLREDMKIKEFALSAWTPILRERSSYVNTLYQEKSSNEVLSINSSSLSIKFWENYYYRYLPGYRSTLVSRSNKK